MVARALSGEQHTDDRDEGNAVRDDEGVDAVPEGHIFISYKSEDRERVRPLAEALERRGWPVWWDRQIKAGESFRKVIAKALEDASCVVVLWSEQSVDCRSASGRYRLRTSPPKPSRRQRKAAAALPPPRKKRRWRRAGALVVVGALAGGGAGIYLADQEDTTTTTLADPGPTVTEPEPTEPDPPPTQVTIAAAPPTEAPAPTEVAVNFFEQADALDYCGNPALSSCDTRRVS